MYLCTAIRCNTGQHTDRFTNSNVSGRCCTSLYVMREEKRESRLLCALTLLSIDVRSELRPTIAITTQSDRVHVVGAGDFSWEIEQQTTSRFFTDQEWEGDDVLTIVALGLFFFICVALGVIYERYCSVKNPRNVGALAMAGSLVGRITLVLIMAEGSIFLATSSRGDALTEGDAEEAADAALAYKYISWVLLLTVFVGDGICAPRCWFT